MHLINLTLPSLSPSDPLMRKCKPHPPPNQKIPMFTSRSPILLKETPLMITTSTITHEPFPTRDSRKIPTILPRTCLTSLSISPSSPRHLQITQTPLRHHFSQPFPNLRIRPKLTSLLNVRALLKRNWIQWCTTRSQSSRMKIKKLTLSFTTASSIPISHIPKSTKTNIICKES